MFLACLLARGRPPSPPSRRIGVWLVLASSSATHSQALPHVHNAQPGLWACSRSPDSTGARNRERILAGYSLQFCRFSLLGLRTRSEVYFEVYSLTWDVATESKANRVSPDMTSWAKIKL